LAEGSVGLSAGLLWSAPAKRCPGRGSDGRMSRWPVSRINGATFPTHRGDGALSQGGWKQKRRRARAGGSSGITSRPRENTRSTQVPDCRRTPKDVAKAHPWALRLANLDMAMSRCFHFQWLIAVKNGGPSLDRIGCRLWRHPPKGGRRPTSHLLCVLCGSISIIRCFPSSYYSVALTRGLKLPIEPLRVLDS